MPAADDQPAPIAGAAPGPGADPAVVDPELMRTVVTGQESDDPGLGGAAPALATGAVVGGRFEIVGQLGAGGMGLVYRAHDRSLDQPVALKMLHADLEHDPRLRDAFRREVRLARLVTHPAVCRLHDLEEADGRHFLTMELIEGESLAERLARGPRLPLAEVTRIGRGIAAGLGAAHAQGVLHLDLTPGNVMLERTGRVVVMDFGVARALTPTGESRERGAIAGTVAYMAPEQLGGGELDPRVDVYGLGLVLYEMACGRVPGLGATVAATAEARLRGAPPDPRADRPDLPERLAQVIGNCLRREPADRYASAAEVLRVLGEGGAAPGDVSGGFAAAAPAPARRRRRTVAVAAAVLALAGIAAGLAWQRQTRVQLVPRIAVVVDERQPTADVATARLRRAAQRLVARELVERGLVATADPRPGARSATAHVRLARATDGFTLEVELGTGSSRLVGVGRGASLAAVAAQGAAAVAAVVRTPPSPLDQQALERTGAASMAAAREVELARAAVYRQDAARARRHAARALELEPGLVAPHLALAAVEEFFTDASRGHLRRAREAARDRTDRTSRLARARARYEVDADDAGGSAELAALYAAYPDDPDVAFYYADALGDLWQVEKANAVLERLLEARPAHIPAMLRLFDLRNNHGEIEQLLRDGARLIEQAPEEPHAYVILGRTLLAAGRLDRALEVFAEALVVDPDHATALTFVGRTLLYRGDVAGARAIARKLLVGPPRQRAAGLRTLGLASLLEGRFAEGQRHLEESLRVCPDDATDGNYTHKVLVYTLEDLGDFAAALAAAQRWEEHATKATFWAQIAYARQEQDTCRLRLGRLTPAEFRARLPVYLADLKAKAGADVVAGQGPKLAMWHAFALGEYREALLAALKDEVPASYTQYLIAESYARLGQHDKAVEWYRRLLTKPDEELIPTIFVRARLRLGDALEALGRRDEANAAFGAFLAAWGAADRTLPELERARQQAGAAPGGPRP